MDSLPVPATDMASSSSSNVYDTKPQPGAAGADMNDKYYHHWTLSILFLVLFLLVLGLIAALCHQRSWFRCQLDQLKQACCPSSEKRGAALTVVSNGVVPETAGSVYSVSFSDPTKLVEAPCGKWTNTLSLVSGYTTQIVGYGVPCSGIYNVDYSVSMFGAYTIGLVLVNGKPVKRSLAFFLNGPDLDPTLGTVADTLGKSFDLFLSKGDVVSVFIVSPVDDNYAPLAPSTHGMTYGTSLALTLVGTKGCHSDSDYSSFNFVMGDNVTAHLTVLNALILDYQASALVAGPNDAGLPATQDALFLNQFMALLVPVVVTP